MNFKEICKEKPKTLWSAIWAKYSSWYIYLHPQNHITNGSDLTLRDNVIKQGRDAIIKLHETLQESVPARWGWAPGLSEVHRVGYRPTREFSVLAHSSKLSVRWESLRCWELESGHWARSKGSHFLQGKELTVICTCRGLLEYARAMLRVDHGHASWKQLWCHRSRSDQQL